VLELVPSEFFVSTTEPPSPVGVEVDWDEEPFAFIVELVELPPG
jgi:hypothetical protein